MLKQNTELIFQVYEIRDDCACLTFYAPDPGPGEDSFKTITLTNEECAALSDMSGLEKLVAEKLQNKFRSSTLTKLLDSYLFKSVVI